MTSAVPGKGRLKHYTSRRLCVVSASLLLSAAGVFAQSPYAPVPPIPLGDVFLSLPTSHVSAQGTWEVKFTHRFNQPLNRGTFSDQVHALFGLDSNADVGLGASYTARPDLELSLYRSNALDGTERDVHDRSSWFAQAVLSRQMGRRAELSVIPTFVTDAGRMVNGTTSVALFRTAFNVPVSAAVMLHQNLSLVAEFIPANRDLPSSLHGNYGWAAGLKSVIGGHFFEILLTNNNATEADQYTTSTYMGSPLRRGDLHLGFNIERRF
jgi:hypothetical protein